MPVTILATTTIEDLARGTGVARTGHGGLFSLSRLLHLGCEAEIVPIVLDAAGGVLGYGRSRRLASRIQRLALAARDGGCCFPACDRPAAWCEAHHIIPWAADGGTDLSNLCLLCAFHHREFERRGWTVTITDGLPEWTPPPWLDPGRKPVRNRAHHPPDLDFAVGSAPLAYPDSG